MINSIGKVKMCVCDKDDNRKRCYFDLDLAGILAALLNPDQSRSVVVGHQSSFVDLVTKNTLVTSECLSSINYPKSRITYTQQF